MGKNKILSICLVAVCAAAFFGGCSLFTGGGGKNSSGTSNNPSSAASSQASEPAGSETSSASSGVITLSQPPESQPGQVLEIQTDSEKFNAKFKDNPIDKKYITDSDKAVSTVDMVNVSEKYSDVWQKEITYAYGELEKYMKTDSSKKPETLVAEQKKWEQEKSASLKKISSEAAADGGSMAQVNAASKAMDFYRARAAQIYHELYDYNKDYTYSISS